MPLNFAHDPDFYKLLRALRWYSAASCPTGNNPSSSSYWSPPGAMEAMAAAAAETITEPAAAAAAAAVSAATAAGGMPAGFFEPAAAVPDAQYFGGYGGSSTAAASETCTTATVPAFVVGGSASVPEVMPRFMVPSPTQGLVVSAAGAAPYGAAVSYSSMTTTTTRKAKGFFSRSAKTAEVKAQNAAAAGAFAAPAPAAKTFPASSWLKSLKSLPGRQKSNNKNGPLSATMAMAQGGYAPLSSATTLPISTLPTSEYAGAAGGAATFGGDALALAAQSRASSRASSISLQAAAAATAGGKRSTHHSPSPSEGSSIVARTAAAEIARNAVAAVVERAAREEQHQQQAAAAGAGEIQPAAATTPAGRQEQPRQRVQTAEYMPSYTRSTGSSPDTWSCTGSVPLRPMSAAVTAPAASGVNTQAALRRLLGFDDEPQPAGALSKVRCAAGSCVCMWRGRRGCGVDRALIRPLLGKLQSTYARSAAVSPFQNIELAASNHCVCSAGCAR